jgi:hypothetical protein
LSLWLCLFWTFLLVLVLVFVLVLLVLILLILGVHCDIYKSSYNRLQLNSPPPSFSFIYPSPIPGIFQQVSFFHFHTWVHNISTVLTLQYPFLISLFPLVTTARQDMLYLPVLCVWKRLFCLRWLCREFPCHISMYLW